MRLLAVELTRLRWRRAVVVIAILGVLVPTLIWAGMSWSSRPVSDAEMQNAERMVAQEKEAMKEQLDDCVANPGNFGIPTDSPDLAEECSMMFGEPEVGWFLTRTPLNPDNATETGIGVAILLLGLALLMGATYAGADWASGSMSNQLLFEPRRIRIWLAKAAAITVATALVAAAGMLAFWGLTAVVAQSRDIQFGAAAWEDIRGLVLRGTLFGAGAGLGGYALTMLLRSTVGTLGLMLAVSIGGSLLVAALPIADNGRWMLSNNVLGILYDGYRYYDYTAEGCNDHMGGTGCEPTLSLGEGLRFIGVLLAAGAALSVASFRRRDVP